MWLADAAKEGDKGPGWVVKSYMTDGYPKSKVLYCEYNGKFILSPYVTSSMNWYSCAKKPAEYMSTNSRCNNDDVTITNTKSTDTYFRLKPRKISKGSKVPTYNIIATKDCKEKYLAAPQNPGSGYSDYDAYPPETVSLSLSKSSKWKWSITAYDTSDGIDCTKVDILSVNRYTHIKMNNDCDGFNYDSDENTWRLIPVQ